MSVQTNNQLHKPFDAVGAFASHVAQTRFHDLPAEAVAKAKTFLLDTVGVGLVGTSEAHAQEVLSVAAQWGESSEATVWRSARRLPAPSAALVNAYRIHCLEYDCIHDRAVVHAMTAVVSALFAWCERSSMRNQPIDGRRFIAGIAVGIDIACLLGMATKSPLRFFRPGTAGGFGATAAIANVAGFDELRVKDALGLFFAQTCGTMQAHVEGSAALGLQMGFNARAAVCAADFVEAGLQGPHDVLTGPFGYFALFENGLFDPAPIEHALGREWQITRLSHKPFPSGRLTHGAIDGMRRLMQVHDFTAGDVEEVTLYVPPLVVQLVGRSDIPAPDSNYAKLCLPFVVGTFLARGRVEVADFQSTEMLNDPKVHALAARVRVVRDKNPDLNAITPQRVVVRLKDGAVHEVNLPAVFGHPDVPLTQDENLDKFRRCCDNARPAVPPPLQDQIVASIDRFENLKDVATLPRLLAVSEKGSASLS